MILKRPLLISVVLLCPICLFLLSDFFQIGRQAPAPVSVEQRATRIEVDKAARRLKLIRGSEILATYDVSLGSNPVGPKSQEGDGRTPEGSYFIDSKNQRSRFHLALHVSYPNIEQRSAMKERGVSPGGDIMIHGLPNGLSWIGQWHLKRDWTDGCIVVTNHEMDNIWQLVAIGTPIEIKP